MTKAKLQHLIHRVESLLADFYSFAPHTTAVEHLVGYDELMELDGSLQQPEAKAHAGVWLVEDPDEMFIGLYLHDEVITILVENCPVQALSNQNLGAFCTLVEELSHFHLILNRLQNGMPVSKLELESVGEIDKLLISSMLLKEQSGKHHAEPLAMQLYDQSRLIGIETKRYEEATKVAARFWYSVLRSQPNDLELAALRKTLQGVYRTPGEYRKLAG